MSINIIIDVTIDKEQEKLLKEHGEVTVVKDNISVHITSLANWESCKTCGKMAHPLYGCECEHY